MRGDETGLRQLKIEPPTPCYLPVPNEACAYCWISLCKEPTYLSIVSGITLVF